MNTRYPTLNFGLGEDIDMLRDAVYQMCQKEIVPRAAEIDRNNEFPMDLWRKFGDMGLLGITVDDTYGGSNMGYLAHSIVMERSVGHLLLWAFLWCYVESMPESVTQKWQ